MQQGGTRGFCVKNRDVSRGFRFRICGQGVSLGCALGVEMSYANSPLRCPFKYIQDRLPCGSWAFSLSNTRGPRIEQQPTPGRREARVRENNC